MKKLLLLAIVIVNFTSCIFLEFDDNYEVVGIASWVWWAIIICVILFVIIGVSGNKDKENTKIILEKQGRKQSDFKKVGNYVGGHPKLNETVNNVVVLEGEKDLELYEQAYEFNVPKFKSTIPIGSVIDIKLEDASSIDKKITLGRVLLVGVFALAWRKNKKNELSFVTIDWQDGKFTHSTIFSFEGTDSLQKANTARNELIQMCKD